MFKRIFLLIALPVALLWAYSGEEKSAASEWDFVLAKGKEISINLTSGGSVKVIGWDKEKVHVSIDGPGRRSEETMIQFHERKSGLDIESSISGSMSGDFRLTIEVPSETDLEIETMGGDLEISGVNGEFSGKTMGGDLNLSDLKGSIQLTTMGGDITLSDSELDGSLKTMGGELFFKNVGGGVRASTMGGDIDLRGSYASGGKVAGDDLNISTMGGDISIDEAQGGIGVQTMGGDIHIKKANDFVKAKTMGGEIQLDEINGGISASTMGGDITAVMTGDAEKGDREVRLSSMGGEITLTLPSNISADFDIRLTYTKNSSRDFKIRSDFDLKIEESPEWIYDHGTPRKIITARGSTKDGQHRVHIDTINGNITIKKGK